MPTIQHNILVGSELHEPKGIDLASLETAYFADGSGSGTWVRIYNHGHETIADNQGPQSLATALSPVANNGAGSRTKSTYRLPAAGAVWSTAGSSFNWAAAGAELGDLVEVRFDVVFTTTGTNRTLSADMRLASGTGTERNIPFDLISVPTATTFSHSFSSSFYIDSADVLNNAAQFRAKSSNAGDTIEVVAFYVAIKPRHPVVAP